MTPLVPYDFLAPSRIVFGWGRRSELGELAAGLGRRAFLVSGAQSLENAGRIAEVSTILEHAGLATVWLIQAHGEPDVETVDQAVSLLKSYEPTEGDLVVGIGGGSAIDLGKAVAGLALDNQSSTVCDYLEGVGRGLQVQTPTLPLIAVPTTAGTGSEATKNAVISSINPPFKKSLRSDALLPRIALVDPELTVTAPPEVTAHSGLDAITQLIESFLSARRRPICTALCRQGLEVAVPAIVEAYEHGESRPAREAMSHAALLSGLALANSGLGMAHGVAAALGIHAGVPHGLACAVMLPVALRVNRDVRLAEIAELGRLMTGRAFPTDAAAADAAVEFVADLCARLQIPARLSALDVAAEQLPDIVRSSRGNSMSGNPRDLSDDELLTILGDML